MSATKGRDASEPVLNPHELGLIGGYRWAEVAAHAGFNQVKELAATGDIPAEIRNLAEEPMRERLAAYQSEDADKEFWAGFVHGVRALVHELGLGSRDA